MDTATLRVSFGVVALCMLLLFYFVAFRSTRSAYCGWWCVALSLYLLGSAAYLLDGTDHQVWANPLGNTLVVAGSAGVWAGTRTITGRRVSLRTFALAPLVTAVASALDSPSTNVWSGGPVFLALMALMIGLAAYELARSVPGSTDLRFRERTYRPILLSMAGMAALVSVFYACRTVAFVVSGQDGRWFDVYFGSEVTTLITTVLLTAVSFSMMSLSHVDDTVDLRARAAHDGLTGLLNRAEFLRVATLKWRVTHRGGAHGTVMLADLDHFKRINDTYGHPAGDFALQTFAAACRGAVRAGDLVCRYGGEEFVLFLDGAPPERAEEVAAQISARMRMTLAPGGMSLPTVSFGIAWAGPGAELSEVIEAADQALYEAKAGGRDRTVVGSPQPRGVGSA